MYIVRTMNGDWVLTLSMSYFASLKPGRRAALSGNLGLNGQPLCAALVATHCFTAWSALFPVTWLGGAWDQPDLRSAVTVSEITVSWVSDCLGGVAVMDRLLYKHRGETGEVDKDYIGENGEELSLGRKPFFRAPNRWLSRLLVQSSQEQWRWECWEYFFFFFGSKTSLQRFLEVEY